MHDKVINFALFLNRLVRESLLAQVNRKKNCLFFQCYLQFQIYDFFILFFIDLFQITNLIHNSFIL